MVIKSSPTLSILPAPWGQGTMKFPLSPSLSEGGMLWAHRAPGRDPGPALGSLGSPRRPRGPK